MPSWFGKGLTSSCFRPVKDVTFIDSVNHLENRHQKGSFGPCQMPVTSHDLDDFGCPFGQASSLENLALWGWFKKQTATTNALTSLLDLIEHTSIHMLYSYTTNYVYMYIYIYVYILCLYPMIPQFHWQNIPMLVASKKNQTWRDSGSQAPRRRPWLPGTAKSSSCAGEPHHWGQFLMLIPSP